MNRIFVMSFYPLAVLSINSTLQGPHNVGWEPQETVLSNMAPVDSHQAAQARLSLQGPEPLAASVPLARLWLVERVHTAPQGRYK